jgi:hypothetical protein
MITNQATLTLTVAPLPLNNGYSPIIHRLRGLMTEFVPVSLYGMCLIVKTDSILNFH